eukprot:GHRR01001230.1.p1 GENE.GHRR01001230.1~~GHRR01001230.1.p1  ORF type:complete len:304 (+),score=62.00 GHRR01001230.1:194-1105(+)
MAPTKTVVVVGATGTLGREVAKALAAKGVRTKGVARIVEDSGEKGQLVSDLKAHGVQLVQGSVTEPAGLDHILKGADVVISALQGDEKVIVDGQNALLEAAKRQQVKKFIPSTFAEDLFGLERNEHPFLEHRLKFHDIVKDSGVPYLHVLNGGFMETLFTSEFGVWDSTTRTLTYWGDGNQKIDTTTFADTGRYTAEAALDDSLTGVFEVAGDVVTFREIAQAIRDVKGYNVKEVSRGSIDDLKAEIKRLREADPSNIWSYIPLMYMLPMLDGRGKLKNIQNDRYPNIKPTSLREFFNSASNV